MVTTERYRVVDSMKHRREKLHLVIQVTGKKKKKKWVTVFKNCMILAISPKHEWAVWQVQHSSYYSIHHIMHTCQKGIFHNKRAAVKWESFFVFFLSYKHQEMNHDQYLNHNI